MITKLNETMTNEFNPSKKDLLLVEQLILDVKSKKNKLIKTKIGLQNQLSQLQEKYKEVDYQGNEFNKIKSKRVDVKTAVTNLDIKIKSLNDELNVKNKLKNEIVFHLKHHKSLEGKEDLDKVILKIKDLKKKYSAFAKDRTRISSLRIMASEFMDELENVIKI